ncbi:hypothetical protein Leryth_026691 [Lithospermum erythrorhizon]|nr:hypothetical protein Leryth_026691 [Lithospermum erythrorhizon]
MESQQLISFTRSKASKDAPSYAKVKQSMSIEEEEQQVIAKQDISWLLYMPKYRLNILCRMMIILKRLAFRVSK